MSERYPGGIITKSPATPTGPYQNGTAPGIWTLDQQLQFQQQGIWPTAGLVPNYIEDVFSTYLYNGNDSTNTITNNINLSANGGLVWIKNRQFGYAHALFDTSRGVQKYIRSNTTDSQGTSSTSLTAFNTNGFTLGSDGFVNNGTSYPSFASWTFRKQAKFFDIVTYTGDGSSNRQISHNLGSAPGCVIVKRTDASGSWVTYHSGLSSASYAVFLNYTNAQTLDATYWNSTAPTSTNFTVGSSGSTNQSGGQFVAYLFASNAGGFGSAGTDNVITCGSFTTDGSGNATVNLGYEPQWVMIKSSSNTGNWFIVDNMRNFAQTVTASLSPNLSNAEATGFGGGGSYFFPTSTGFQSVTDLAASQTYIYIAIRRGPMATPTTGTSVFDAQSAQDTNTSITTNFPVDMTIDRYNYQTDTQANQAGSNWVYDRLRGTDAILVTSSTAAEVTSGSGPAFYVSTTGFQSNTKLNIGPGDGSLGNYYAYFWNFKRAPGFFDEVCSTGFVDGTLLTHNLGVTPELIIVKTRNSASSWMGAVNDAGNIRNLSINTTSGGYLPGFVYSSYFNATTINPTGILNGAGGSSKGSGVNVVAYLFATVAGVSKVGTFTGTGGTQTINCGFGAGGARWLLVKRTDSTGDWYVFDSARGFTSSSSPYLLMNSTAAQVTGNNGCYAASTGFTVTSTANATVNINGATYIFLAIA